MKKRNNKTIYRLNMRGYSYLLVLIMLMSTIVTPLSGVGLWATEEENGICYHEHSLECLALPADHECSEELGCLPLYSPADPGHIHNEECWESGELICTLDEGDGAVEPELIGWDCAALLPGLTCEHADCVFGEPCLVSTQSHLPPPPGK